MSNRVQTLVWLSVMGLCAGTAHAEDAPGHKSGVPKFLTKEIIAIFEPGSLPVPDGDRFSELNFRLFRPTIEQGRHYPLILFLNGHAKDQLDYHNVGQLKHLQSIIFRELMSPKKYPFFLLAVQCPKDESDQWLSWEANSPGEPKVDPIEASMRVVDRVVSEHPIDRDRVTICGISSGGNAAWELAARHPDRFAAIVPLGSVGADISRLERLKDISVWALHSSGDEPGRVRVSIDRLDSLGGDAHLTEIPNEAHACWDEAFRDYDTLNWMLAQRIGPDAAEDSELFNTSIKWQVAKHYLLTAVGRQEAWNATWPRVTSLVGAIVLFIACRNQMRKGRGPHNHVDKGENATDSDRETQSTLSSAGN